MKTSLVLLPGMLSNHVVWNHQIQNLDDLASIQVIPTAQDTPEKMVSEILKQAPPQRAC